jgi:signal transduction histidine kinase
MSASSGIHSFGSAQGRPFWKPSNLFLWAVSAGWLAILSLLLIDHAREIAAHKIELLPWLALMIFINLMPLPGWQSTHIAVDLPVATAAALILSPAETGLIAFLGAFDTREFRQQRIAFRKALFNRSQVGLADFVGSFVVHAVARSPSSSSLLLALGFLALASISCVNYLLVGLGLSLERDFPIRDVLKRLRMGTLTDFVLTFLTWGVLGAMLAALYARIHSLALLGFLAPTLMGRQILMRSQMFLDTDRAYRSREEAVNELSRRMHEERLDERRLIAADLHDEVLQPLFKVSLMGHVLKADLSGGRLLEIDEDLPELLAAAEMASRTLRELIGDLRKSTLGRGGLSPALTSLIRGLTKQTPVSIQSDIRDVELEPQAQLATYNIAKEALSNALMHSKAESVWLQLDQLSGDVVLVVQDDGCGFDSLVEKEGHYGLKIMRERAASIGGDIYVDSSPGTGTRITLTIPARGEK